MLAIIKRHRRLVWSTLSLTPIRNNFTRSPERDWTAMDQFEMLRQSGLLNISGISAVAGAHVFAGVNIHPGSTGILRNSLSYQVLRLIEFGSP
jgi:hypothetical protein